MERSVIVFDTDSSRASVACDVLSQANGREGIQVETTNSYEELARMLEQDKVDVLFCDLRVNDQLSRINGCVTKIVNDALSAGSSMQVVYTGVTEENLVSIEFSDYAFLLPATMFPNDLLIAFNKAVARQDKYLERPLMVKTRNACKSIQPARVSYIESDLRKIRIHMGGEVVEVYGRLSEILRKLPNRFMQCHKSFVVNLGCVDQLERDFLVLSTGEHVPVSQKRRKITREAFASYIGRSL